MEYYSFGTLDAMNYFNMQPSSVKGSANITVDYEKRYLAQKLFSVYEFTIPDNWSLAYLRYMLFYWGSVAVIYTDRDGWIMSEYGITKISRYYIPAEIEVYDKWLSKTLRGVLGVNAEIVYILDDRYGMDDLITRYATQLAEIDKQISVNLMTCGTGYVFWAADKKSADTVKEMWARSSTGEPLVIGGTGNLNDRGQGIEMLNPDVSKNYIVNDLLVSRRTIINNYLTEIGINNNNFEKRERVTNEEIRQNNEEIKSLSDIIYDNIKKCFDNVNKISGLGLKVIKRKGDCNATSNTVGNATMGYNVT